MLGELVEGDDGSRVEVVGSWAKEKHELLCRYIDVSRMVRSKWSGPGKAGSTYIDLFSGPGRAKVRKTGEFIDGSCVAAWRKSVEGGSPFTAMFVADNDSERLNLATERLRALGAPVVPILGAAVDTVKVIKHRLNPYGLHFAFVDPYNLGAFDFEVMRSLSSLTRIDMLVHVSKMDLQRNLGFNITSQQRAFETFAPGWRDAVNLNQTQPAVRREVFEYWRGLVAALGVAASTEMRLITGSRHQPLYWLMLAAKHDLAHKFWKVAAETGQQELF
jgi:three-Cys-motif partner protein|tara:strand:- start:10841 stop:11665 length:825 start_codon:yes stop_codon:yes gene_type:complete